MKEHLLNIYCEIMQYEKRKLISIKILTQCQYQNVKAMIVSNITARGFSIEIQKLFFILGFKQSRYKNQGLKSEDFF